MIYIVAVLVPPLGLLLNGQPFAAVLNIALIIPCLLFGLVFHVLLLVPSLHAVRRGPYEARGAPAPRDRPGDRAARPAAGVGKVERRLNVIPSEISAISGHA